MFVLTGMVNSVGEIIPTNLAAQIHIDLFLLGCYLMNSMQTAAHREVNDVPAGEWQDSNHSRPANINDGILGAG